MKIRKSFQGTIPENKIMDTLNNSQTDTYSCRYINKLNNVTVLYENKDGLVIKTDAGKEFTVDGMPDVSGYENKIIRFYIGYVYDAKTVYSIMLREDWNTAFIEYKRDYNGNDMWHTMFAFYNMNTTTWTFKTCMSYIVNSNGSITTSGVNYNHNVKLFKIEVVENELEKSSYADANVYSTEEQVIGTWIDGKPIYRKTLYISGGLSFNSSHKYIFNHNIENFKMTIKLSGIIYDSENKDYYILPYVTTGTANIMLFNSTTQIKVEQIPYGSGRLMNLYVIMEYTKTTD